MRAFSRILQVILLCLAALFLIFGLATGKHLGDFLMLSFTLALLSITLGIGLDPTLKNPTALKYFKAAIYGVVFIGIPLMVISLVVALLSGEKREALRTTGYLVLVIGYLWRSRREIFGKLSDIKTGAE